MVSGCFMLDVSFLRQKSSHLLQLTFSSSVHGLSGGVDIAEGLGHQKGAWLSILKSYGSASGGFDANRTKPKVTNGSAQYDTGKLGISKCLQMPRGESSLAF
jgi:hypothetical protein